MGQEFILLVSASVFCVGACGFVIRKNPSDHVHVGGVDAQFGELSPDHLFEFFKFS